MRETVLPEGLKKIHENLTGASLKFYNKLENNAIKIDYLEAIKDEKMKDRKKGVWFVFVYIHHRNFSLK